MDYGELVASYQKIEDTTSTDEKTTVVASALGNATMEEIRMLLPLFQGAVTPAYEQADLGISSNLTLQAITKATGVAQSDVETTWRETGDLGTAAANASNTKHNKLSLLPTLPLSSFLKPFEI